MKKYHVILAVSASCILLFAVLSYADITLTNGEWSTTFNCPDWQWAYPNQAPTLTCDGLSTGVGGSSGYYIRINSADNNPNGGGGKGLGWQVDNGNVTSTSPTGSGLDIKWSGSTHFWIRWYVKFPPGLSIGYGGPNIYGWKVGYFWDGSQSFYIDANYNGVGMSLYDRSTRFDGQYGFSDAVGSTKSNGTWVAVEMEFDIPNHIWRYWFYTNNVDSPTPKYQASNVSYPISKISKIGFPSNIRSSQIASNPATVCFDDIAISTVGRIGPVGPATGGGGSTNNVPVPPTGLTVKGN